VRITKSQLKRIIKEELEQVLFEHSSRDQRNVIEEGRFGWMTTALAIGSMLGLAGLQNIGSGDGGLYSAAATERVRTELHSIDANISDLERGLHNTAAWSWTTDADSRETFPTMEAGGVEYHVMPPEYSIYQQVLDDKENFKIVKKEVDAGGEPQISPTGPGGLYDYGPPGSSIEKLAASQSDLGDFFDMIKKKRNDTSTTSMAQKFMEDFSQPGDYELTDKVAGGKRLITPKWEKLKDYDKKLPLSGLTPEEAYQFYMYGQYFSEDEKELFLTPLTQNNP
jgi:hypothetical protein